MFPAGGNQIKSAFIAATSGLYLLVNNKYYIMVQADTLFVGVPHGVFYDGSNVYCIGARTSGIASLIRVSAYTQYSNGAYIWVYSTTAIQVATFGGNPTGLTGNGNGLLWISTNQGIYQYNTNFNNGFYLITNITAPSGVRFYDNSLFITDYYSGSVFEYPIGGQYVYTLDFTLNTPMGFYISGSTVLQAGIALAAMIISLVI